MTALESIYKELSEKFKDEPNKNMILGYTMGCIEKHRPKMVEETAKAIKKSMRA